MAGHHKFMARAYQARVVWVENGRMFTRRSVAGLRKPEAQDRVVAYSDDARSRGGKLLFAGVEHAPVKRVRS